MIWLLPLVGVLSLVLTALLRRYALARSIIDIPNARSSHTLPTPRGGGVAIVAAFLLAQLMLAREGLLEGAALASVFGSGLLVAIIGFIDDHGHIAAGWRLLGHFCAAAWALAWLGGMPPVQVFGTSLSLGWLGHVLAAFYLVWMLNLYNFMDGIDGIAGVEAITVCLGCCLLYWLAGMTSLIWAPLLLAMAVVGFLYWNLPPARIFMGDAGSGFLGMVLGVLSLLAAWQSSQLLWAWLILLGVFVVDASFTLGRRLLRGEKVYEAHRSHAYQFASRQHGGHLFVTLGVLVINLFWLLPIACYVVWSGEDGLLGLIVAYVPLFFLARYYRAGLRES
ncbi:MULTISPECIES: MraY family glycosyltransferase [Pseudomonas]|uniref:Putative undecaprenyl-phosphate N-acetylglucosaminyl 1-phosphate transferase n=1 Tax=Pseudomonas putida TaxID=303 RepID=A0A1B2F1H5_PSEPU|nr:MULTISPECIES: glycosyltransferase family 4 protein [Pseudomonas]ANY86042.1 putative undecaprenyl-phosphate N-acetylglucosaminyl 1-phosphate transferase [Pseudomonas putida]